MSLSYSIIASTWRARSTAKNMRRPWRPRQKIEDNWLCWFIVGWINFFASWYLLARRSRSAAHYYTVGRNFIKIKIYSRLAISQVISSAHNAAPKQNRYGENQTSVGQVCMKSWKYPIWLTFSFLSRTALKVKQVLIKYNWSITLTTCSESRSMLVNV